MSESSTYSNKVELNFSSTLPEINISIYDSNGLLVNEIIIKTETIVTLNNCREINDKVIKIDASANFDNKCKKMRASK
jgi:hypothetical protein